GRNRNDASVSSVATGLRVFRSDPASTPALRRSRARARFGSAPRCPTGAEAGRHERQTRSLHVTPSDIVAVMADPDEAAFLERLTQLGPPLLSALEAFEVARRRLDPGSVGLVRHKRQPFAAWPVTA